MGYLVGEKDGAFSITQSRSSLFQKKKTSYTREFHVLGESIDENWSSIQNTKGLPRLLQDYYGDGCKCKTIELKEVSTVIVDGRVTLKWDISCKFDSEVVSGNAKSNQDQNKMENPINWPIELSVSSEEETRDLLEDAIFVRQEIGENGQLGDPQPLYVTNPNGEPYEIQYNVALPVVEFSRFEPYLDDAENVADIIHHIKAYSYKLNSSPFMGFDTGTCLMLPPSAHRESINGAYYYKITYRIKFGEVSDFQKKVLCQGNKVRVDGQVKTTKEVYGSNITVNLDENGEEIPEGGEPYYEIFNQYKLADFNALKFYPDSMFQEQEPEINEGEE